MTRKREKALSRDTQWLKRRKMRMEADSVEMLRRKSTMNLGMLNMEGWKEQKMMDVRGAMRVRDLDTMVLIETHLRRESNEKIKVKGCEVFESRRSDAEKDKKGGGLAIICRKKEGVVFSQHKPNVKDPNLAYINKERIWVTTTTPGGKTAICGVYLACQAKDNHHIRWNEGIYRVLSEEIFALRAKGFRISLQGDFNSWVGDSLSQGGIPGNHRKITRYCT
jgi:hypothetical protein